MTWRIAPPAPSRQLTWVVAPAEPVRAAPATPDARSEPVRTTDATAAASRRAWIGTARGIVHLRAGRRSGNDVGLARGGSPGDVAAVSSPRTARAACARQDNAVTTRAEW